MTSTLTDISRRVFIERFAQAAFGVSFLSTGSALCADQKKLGGKAKSTIVLYLRGGVSHVDTLDPKPGKPEMGGVQSQVRVKVDTRAWAHQAGQPTKKARSIDLAFFNVFITPQAVIPR